MIEYNDGSWDRTVKLWDVLESRAATLTLPHSAELLSIAVRPDGRELVASCMDGTLVTTDDILYIIISY
jgi:periodic tryptophan protein 2